MLCRQSWTKLEFLPAQALSGIVYEVKGRSVDAVLFLNRLDDFRVDASGIQVLQLPSFCLQHIKTHII